MELSEQMEQEFQQMLEKIKRERGIRVLPSFMERELRRQFVEGYEEGRAEGRAEGLRIALLRSLESLYGKLPKTVVQRILRIDQDEVLLELQVEAIRSGSLDSFRQKLDALTGALQSS